jgi:glycosyltransferase involved in cell wall biosynthesis
VKVLHVVPRLLADDGRLAGGGERYPMELAAHMAKRVPTRLLSFGKRSWQGTMQGVPVRIIGGDWAARGREHNPFSTQLFAEVLQADVVHCHQREVLASKLAAACCRLGGGRVAVTDHGGGAWDWTGRLPTDWLFHHHLHVSRFSIETAGHHRRRTARVILAGVDADRFSPGRAPGAPRRALFVGRVLPHKGVDDLILGLPDGIGLDVVGPALDSRFLGDLRELARGRDVAFRHDLDDDELIEAYRAALCVVLPSKYRHRYGGETQVPELLGQTLLEGMACGRPVICTRAGGMPEIVADGETGFVVEPGDPHALRERLAWLAEHPDDREAMGRAARARVLAEFTWDRVVDRCFEAYRVPA